MRLLRPADWHTAVAMKADCPEAVPLAGGTHVVAAMNAGEIRPRTLLDLAGIAGFADCLVGPGSFVLHAGVTYSDLISLGVPRSRALALASAAVGSVQIRNRGTVGGAIAHAEPSGDILPALLAAGAEVELISIAGSRRVPIDHFFISPGRSVLAPTELLLAVHVRTATGPQRFARVGLRQAMVRASCSFALAIDLRRRRFRTGLGAVGPTPIRASAAEAYLSGYLDKGSGEGWGADLPASVYEEFTHLVGKAAKPVDDIFGSSAFKTHALRVIAGRLLQQAWAEVTEWPSH